MSKVATDIDAAIGARLRSMRLARGMSQERLGDRLGITFQQVQKYEKGTNRISGSRLVEAAKVLGTSVAAIVGGEGAPEVDAPVLDRAIHSLNQRLAAYGPRVRPHAIKAINALLDGLDGADFESRAR